MQACTGNFASLDFRSSSPAEEKADANLTGHHASCFSALVTPMAGALWLASLPPLPESHRFILTLVLPDEAGAPLPRRPRKESEIIHRVKASNLKGRNVDGAFHGELGRCV